MKMTISVVIPAYNHENTISQLIEFLFKQKKQFNLEIIVVDDKSSDRTPEILAEYKGIKVIRNKKNYGLASSLNIGMKYSSGNFIWIIHGDCIPHNEFLKTAMEFFKKCNDVGVVCAQADLPLEIWKNYSFYDKIFHIRETLEYNKKRIMHNSFIIETKGLCGGMKTVIFRRLVFDDIGPFNSEKFRAAGEDEDTGYKLKKTKWKIIKINCPSKHLHAINKTNVKLQLKKIIRLNEAKATLLRIHGKIAFHNIMRNKYWNPLTITIFYLTLIFLFLFSLFVPSLLLNLFKWCLFSLFLIELLIYPIRMAKIEVNWKLGTLPFIKFTKNICIIYGFWKGFILSKQKV